MAPENINNPESTNHESDVALRREKKRKNMKKKYKEIDYLSEDDEIPGQKWICISFVSPEGIANCKVRAVKVRGVYQDKETADRACEKLSIAHPDHNIFVGEMGKWLAWDQDPSTVEDERYHDDKLQNLMKNYKENRAKAKRMEAERKADMLADVFQEKLSNKDKLTRRLQKKLKEKREKEVRYDKQRADHEEKLREVEEQKSSKAKKVIESESDDEIEVPVQKSTQEIQEELKQARDEFDNEKELSKTEGDRIKNINQNIMDREKNIQQMDNKLEKIKNLYKNLQSKSKPKE